MIQDEQKTDKSHKDGNDSEPGEKKKVVKNCQKLGVIVHFLKYIMTLLQMDFLSYQEMKCSSKSINA